MSKIKDEAYWVSSKVESYNKETKEIVLKKLDSLDAIRFSVINKNILVDKSSIEYFNKKLTESLENK